MMIRFLHFVLSWAAAKLQWIAWESASGLPKLKIKLCTRCMAVSLCLNNGVIDSPFRPCNCKD